MCARLYEVCVCLRVPGNYFKYYANNATAPTKSWKEKGETLARRLRNTLGALREEMFTKRQ